MEYYGPKMIDILMTILYDLIMRITIRIDDELLKQAKQLAASSGKSFTAIIEDALRESLSRQKLSGSRQPVHLVTFIGNGLLPGVDLDDSAALLDLIESVDDSLAGFELVTPP